MFLVIKTGFNFPKHVQILVLKKSSWKQLCCLMNSAVALSESVRVGMLGWCASAETHFADVSQSVAAILISETRPISIMLPETLFYCHVDAQHVIPGKATTTACAMTFGHQSEIPDQ